MSLKWWWLAIVLLVPILVAMVWRWRRPAPKRSFFVSNIPSAKGLPSFAREHRRGQLLRWAESILLALLIIILICIAARPQQQIRKVEYENSRDIVLCMDISGSMDQYVEPALQTLKKVVEANPTDRYSLVMFRNAPYVALPLTSDTVAIGLTVNDLLTQFADDSAFATSLMGYDSTVPGGTDIGAGLAACFRRFDAIEQQRSRHIILVSDMQHNGLTDQAAVATLLPKYDVQLHVVAPEFDVQDAEEGPVVQITGANVESLDFEGNNAEETLRQIYNSILTARRTESYVSVDTPYIWWGAAAVVTGAWVAVLVIRWRRR